MLRARRDPIRVVVIDDSPTIRDLLSAVLETAEGIQVVGAGANGEEALRLVSRLKPDVVTMDVRMPRMDGLEATRRIMRDMPTRIVVVADNLMHASTDLTFEALKAGALTVVRKPGLRDPETCDQVIEAVRLMADVPVIHRWSRREDGRIGAVPGMCPGLPLNGRYSKAGELVPQDLRLSAGRTVAPAEISMIGIASSTGGPAALAKVLGALPPSFQLPILVVQHVTPGFGVGLAEWLDTQTPLSVTTAGHGERPRAGTVLIAPDDYHMQINLHGVVELVREQPYRGLRPSANYLFGSLARAFGPRAMGIILTGMGDDGVDGLEALHLVGGLTVAQDETSSVVYGMPREAVMRNAVDRVLALDQIASTLVAWSGRRQEDAA